ncbi:MAG TPA: NUDIX hydrolase [Acidimicrobiales bacterium]|nr:NUDIX hydrolase [Acidimicrobiales bacterium]
MEVDVTETPQLPMKWDGLFLSPVPPWGASVVVRRAGPDGRSRVLIVQRDRRASGQWTPPCATRLPGEDMAACARRALDEIVGLSLPIVADRDLQPGWGTFVARAGEGTEIRLGPGFDAFDWVEPEEARRRCAAGSAAAFALVA